MIYSCWQQSIAENLVVLHHELCCLKFSICHNFIITIQVVKKPTITTNEFIKLCRHIYVFLVILLKLQSSQLCNNNFPWSAVLKFFGIVSITDSYGNQATNFPMVLLRRCIHVLSIFKQWVGKYKTVSDQTDL